MKLDISKRIYLEKVKSDKGEKPTFEEEEKDYSPTDVSTVNSEQDLKKIEKRPEKLKFRLIDHLNNNARWYATALLATYLAFIPFVCNRILIFNGKINRLEERNEDIKKLDNKVDSIKDELSKINLSIEKLRSEIEKNSISYDYRLKEIENRLKK